MTKPPLMQDADAAAAPILTKVTTWSYVGGIHMTLRREEIALSFLAVSCICSVCKTVFKISERDQALLIKAKRKTGKKPRCEKCGGNDAILASVRI